MSSFKELLTLGRVRGFINEGVLPSFTGEELFQVWDWLDDLSIEVELMKQHVQKARGIGANEFTSKPAPQDNNEMNPTRLDGPTIEEFYDSLTDEQCSWIK